MPRETVKLSVEVLKSTGQVRYKRMHRGKRWKSRVFDSDSRRNKSAAWEAFVLWRQDRDEQLNRAEAEKRSAAAESGTRAEVVGRRLISRITRGLRDYAELTGDEDDRRDWEQLSRLAETANECQIRKILEGDTLQLVPIAAFSEHIASAARANRNDPPELQLQTVVGKYLKRLAQRVESGDRSAKLLSSTAESLDKFVAFYGAERSVEFIDEDTVADYSLHLRDDCRSIRTAYNHWGNWKTFVRRTCENYRLTAPANLASSEHQIPKGTPQVVTFTPDEVGVLLDLASPRVELYLLLMLNCGMTQQEIADIQADNVDWTAGRIRWSRTKTKRHAPPTINYLLWDRTWERLQEFGNREGLVVCKQDGSPLIVKTVRYNEDGSYRDVRRADSVVSNWRHLERRAKRDHFGPDWSKPLKAFRKTGASLLETSDYAELVDMHLNHKRVARQHYLKPGQIVPRFDEAIEWLGKQFGLRSTRNR